MWKNWEASSLDWIKMTKNWLEFDQKIFSTTNIIFWIWPKFMTPTSINFPQKKICWSRRLRRYPSPSSQTCTDWETCPALLALSLCSSTRNKTSGTEVRRTLDVKLRFVSFIRCISFNFGHVQLLRFVVMVRSSWFGQVNNPQNWICKIY